MRASRAYIAGFGTTSVLVASAILLLAVVSTLVAFNGWPGTGLSQSISNLAVDEPKQLAVEGSPQVAQNAASAAAAVTSSPAPGTAAAAATGLRGVQGADVQRAPETGASPTFRDPDLGGSTFRDDQGAGTQPPNPPPVDQPAGGLLPETPLSPQVNRVTSGLGDTTQGLTDNLGGTLGQVNPQLGQTVTDTGRLLAELLRGLGRPQR